MKFDVPAFWAGLHRTHSVRLTESALARGVRSHKGKHYGARA